MSQKDICRFFAFASIIFLLANCAMEKADNETKATERAAPVLVVNDKYTFSMYPEYLNETSSKLKFDIRDGDRFVSGAKVDADLQAQDGHESTAAFKEDTLTQKYVAEIPLKHHEDYVIRTRVSIEKQGKNIYSPKFVFHCCDPILAPGGINSTESVKPGGSKNP